jgi:hypothetical protein
MELFLIVLIVSLKFIVPAFMLWFPFYGVWANYFLDIVDGDVLLQLGMADSLYQTIDKSADLISYVFMLLLGWRWRIRKTVAVLFAYRFIGQMLFFITRDERVFLYFQNFLEPLILIYVFIIFKQKSEEKAYAVYRKHIVLIWGGVLAYKLWNEWYLHVANIDLSLLLFGVTGGK